MSWEHAGEAREALQAIVNDPQHGVAALSSAQTMSNLLKDLLPDAPREKSILVAAAEAGLADTLRQHVSQGMDPDTAIRLAASSFSSTTPFTPEACTWVAGEIATALGMRHSATGTGGGGRTAFDPGQQGAPTQIGPIPGYTPGQQPTQGIPRAPGPGGYGAGAGPTTPGPWQPTGPQPGQPGGQPGGGFGQPSPAGWQGQQQQRQAGFGQVQPAAGFGQPAAPPAGGGWQPAAPGGYQPAAPTGPMGPMIPGGPGGPVKTGGRGRWLAIGGGVAAVAVVAIVLAVSLGGGSKNNPKPPPTPPTTSPVPTPSPTPTLSPHPPGTEALVTIMNPAGAKPVGTHCEAAKTFTINASTLDASTFCPHSLGVPNVEVWGYQFNSFAHYEAGLKSINHFVGFDTVTPSGSCPPASGSTTGKVGWHAIHNPRYFRRSGQDIECFVDHNKPVVIWTMPTQDAFFIGQDRLAGSTLTTLIDWWKKLSYG